MTTQSQIYQTFARHWEFLRQGGKAAWLIKGDFDHFKLTNDLYGALITDYLLDWTLEVIEEELAFYQSQWGCGDLLCNVIGDDVTIYVPPSPMTGDIIAQLLWNIREAIEKSFYQRYLVGAVPLPADFFEDVPPDVLERMRNELESMDVVLDFAARRQGYLLLLPNDSDGRYLRTFEIVLRAIQRLSGKIVPPVDLHLDWICNPDEPGRYTFNRGFVDPPLVSFAACSTRMALNGKLMQAGSSLVFERLSLAGQAALKTCKRQRQGVVIAKDDPFFAELAQADGMSAAAHIAAAHLAAVSALDTPLRWSSERLLRERFYFQRLHQPVLFQFNPVYRLNSQADPHADVDPHADLGQTEQYRGNRYGIGLKGINELLGQNAADGLIRQLISIFSKVMQAALVAKGIPPEQVHVAQFVDRFTICFEQPRLQTQPALQLQEMVELVRCLARLFNSVSDEITISHLRTSAVLGDHIAVGYRLFHQLTLATLSPQSLTLAESDPPIELRQYGATNLQNDAATILQNDGCWHLERRSFSSARRLSDLKKGVMVD